MLNKDFVEGLNEYVKKNYDPKDLEIQKTIDYYSTEGIISRKQNNDYRIYIPVDSGPLAKKIESNKITTTWQRTVFNIIDEKEYNDPDVYKRAFISKQTFSKIRSDVNYQPARLTAIQMCFGLRLSLEESIDLLEKAGYAFANSNVADLIFKYFLEEKNYSLVSLNDMLYKYDCETIPDIYYN